MTGSQTQYKKIQGKRNNTKEWYKRQISESR